MQEYMLLEWANYQVGISRDNYKFMLDLIFRAPESRYSNHVLSLPSLQLDRRGFPLMDVSLRLAMIDIITALLLSDVNLTIYFITWDLSFLFSSSPPFD